MEIKIINKEELDYIRAICLDPSVDHKSKVIMQSGMTKRLEWVKNRMLNGLEIFVAFENPLPTKIHYKWAGKMLHSDLAVRGQVPKGLLESIPIEHALEPVKGNDTLFINCMWILPPFWDSGTGKALLNSFIERASHTGGASVIAYDDDNWFGTTIKYMPCSFFKKFGFKMIKKDETRVLMHQDLGAKNPPELIPPKSIPIDQNYKVNLDVLISDQCPWSTYMIKEIEDGVKRYPDVNLNIIQINSRKQIEKFGLSRGVFINGNPVIKRMAPWKEVKREIDAYLK